MINKYFVVSDIHGDYTGLKLSLKTAGFKLKNKNHILIVVGDVFDRFKGVVKVYKFLKSIPADRLVLITGNHEQLYTALLKKDFPEEYDFSNGTVGTFCQIAEMTKLPDGGDTEEFLRLSRYYGLYNSEDELAERDHIWHEVVAKVKNSEITEWITSSVWKNYYEVDNFIFTHSFIPKRSEHLPLENWEWRNATDLEWGRAMWGCPWKRYQEGVFAEEEAKGKTLVVGHWHTSDFFRHLKHIYTEDTGIYYSAGLIGLDGGANYSWQTNKLLHYQNVLVIDNNICYNEIGEKLVEAERVPIIETVTE